MRVPRLLIGILAGNAVGGLLCVVATLLGKLSGNFIALIIYPNISKLGPYSVCDWLDCCVGLETVESGHWTLCVLLVFVRSGWSCRRMAGLARRHHLSSDCFSIVVCFLARGGLDRSSLVSNRSPQAELKPVSTPCADYDWRTDDPRKPTSGCRGSDTHPRAAG